MDRYEGRAWLDWWANSITLLGSIGITVKVEATATGWIASGRLASEDDRDDFAFLCGLDPVFSLRFDDDSTVTVDVALAGNQLDFSLSEYAGPRSRPINHVIDLRRLTE